MSKCRFVTLLCIVTLNLSANLSGGQENFSTGKFFLGELIIKIKPEIDSLSLQSSLQNLELTKLASATRGNWILVGFDKNTDVLTKINSVKNSPIIEWVQPNYIYELCATIPNDTHFDSLWSLHNTGQYLGFACGGNCPFDADIDAAEAWDTTKGNSNLKIAILDSGIPLNDSGKLSHPDLDDTSKFILGWNCLDSNRCISAESLSVKDIAGHGSHVTGIAAAESNNNTGIAGIVWFCKLLVIKASAGSTVDSLSGWRVTNAIRKAIEDSAKVISMSIGGTRGDSSTYGDLNMEAAIAYAESNGVVICAAVGNEAAPDILYPAAYASRGDDSTHRTGYRNVIAVGGTKFNDDLYAQSNYGNDTMKVTVTAPAIWIFSTIPSGYQWEYGTSMAAPHVTGVAGLVRSKYPTISADSVRTIIENTSDKVWQDPAKAAYANNDTIYHDWNRKYGFGRVNAFRAVTRKTLLAPVLDSAKVVRDSKDTTHWIKSFWSDISADEDSFKIYRTVFSTPYQYSKVAATAKNVTTYQDHWSNLVGSETYIYRVRTHENISNSGNFSDSAKVKNIPNKPVQKTPLVIFDMASCCLGLGPGGCDSKTNKVIVKWDKPANQKSNTLTKYKIKVKKPSGAVYWFTHTDVTQDTIRDTLCLWINLTCSLWVYAYDATDSSNASNVKVTTTGPCQVCSPPGESKIGPFDFTETQEHPKHFSLSQNYPNPFNLNTQISYAIPQNADVEITIYNILGRKVKTLNLGHQAPGYKTVTWDGKDNSGNEVASGIYFYRIVAGEFNQTQKMTLLK